MLKISFYIVLLRLMMAPMVAQVIVEPSASIELTGNAALYIQTSVQNTGNIILGAGEVHITGDWTNSGTVQEGTSTVSFEGTNNQFLTSGGETFYNLSLDKNNALLLQDNAAVKNNLSFTNGMLYTSTAYHVDLGATGTISGETNGRFAEGNVRVNRPINANADNMGGVGLVIDGTANAQNLGTVTLDRFAGAGVANYSYGQSGANKSIDCIFNVQPQNLPTANIDYTFDWLSDWDNGLSVNSLYLWHSDDNAATWLSDGTVYNGTSRSISFSSDNIDMWTFSSFQPLPVEWLDFTATLVDTFVQLHWVVAQEMNNDHFTMLHSTDANLWQEIGDVNSIGNHVEPYLYAGKHLSPKLGINYYQIRQTDLDGTQSLSNIRSVFLTPNSSFSVYPNPNDGHFTFEVTGTDISADLELVNVLGQVVYRDKVQKFAGRKDIAVEVADGIYHLRIKEKNGQTHSVKMLIE